MTSNEPTVILGRFKYLRNLYFRFLLSSAVVGHPAMDWNKNIPNRLDLVNTKKVGGGELDHSWQLLLSICLPAYFVSSLPACLSQTYVSLCLTHKAPPTICSRWQFQILLLFQKYRERSGSVVECLTRDRRAAGSSLTGVTALWSLSKTHLS